MRWNSSFTLENIDIQWIISSYTFKNKISVYDQYDTLIHLFYIALEDLCTLVCPRTRNCIRFYSMQYWGRGTIKSWPPASYIDLDILTCKKKKKKKFCLNIARIWPKFCPNLVHWQNGGGGGTVPPPLLICLCFYMQHFNNSLLIIVSPFSGTVSGFESLCLYVINIISNFSDQN